MGTKLGICVNKHPFGQLPETSASDLLTDDFPHDHIETWKNESDTNKGGVFNYTFTKDITRKNGKWIYDFNDALKLEFPVDGTDFDAKLLVNRQGDVETHVDLGGKKVGDDVVFFFSNFKTKFDFSTSDITAGANYFSKKFASSTLF